MITQKLQLKKILKITSFVVAFALSLSYVQAANFSLSNNNNLVKNCSSSIQILMDTQGDNIMAADSTIAIDNSDVDVHELSIGTQLPMQVFSQISSDFIKLSGARFPMSGSYNGSGTFGYISFTPLVSGNIDFNFSQNLNVDNIIIDENIENVITSATNKTYSVQERYNTEIDGIGFCTPDASAPNVQFINPTSGSSNNPIDTNIIFIISDDRTGTKIDSLSFSIDGVNYTSSSSQVSVETIGDNYRITVNPNTNFNLGDNIPMSVYVCDNNSPANCATKTGSFRIFTPAPPPAECGNGIVEPQNGEQCDDGNTNNSDACSNLCLLFNPNNTSTCFDGIHNQDETGIDCGGSCTQSCPTCIDGISNQNEEGVDCGGPCQACGESSCENIVDTDYMTICHHDPNDPESSYSLSIPSYLWPDYESMGDTRGYCLSGDLKPIGISLYAYPLSIGNFPYIKIISLAKNATIACFSGDIEIDGDEWCTDYNSEYDITVSSGDGHKVINAYFKNSFGEKSNTLSTTFELDTTPPQAPEFKMESETNVQDFTIELLNAYDAEWIYISGDVINSDNTYNWIGIADFYNFQLTNGYDAGIKTIYIQSKDRADNLSEKVTYTINYNPKVSRIPDVYDDELDTDGDGLSDLDEIQTYRTNPYSSDTDNDFLSDYDEIKTYYTDPLNEDTDEDRCMDGTEISQASDPLDGHSHNCLVFIEPTEGNELGSCQIDTDNDGISNCMELIYGTDPNNPDTDGDGYTDGEELLDFGTNPLDPNSNPGNMNNRIIISNWKNEDVMIGTNWFVKGSCNANEKLEVYLLDNKNNSISLGETTCHVNNVFIMENNVDVKDGYYTLKARYIRSPNTKSSDIYIVVDKQRDMSGFEITYLDEHGVNMALGLTAEKITTTNQKPTVYGKTQYGMTVHASFESIVTASAIIVDSKLGEFAITAPRELEPGLHKARLYALSPEGFHSSTVTIPFEIVEDSSLHSSFQVVYSTVIGWWWIIILLILIIVVLYLMYKNEQDKEEDIKNKPNHS